MAFGAAAIQDDTPKSKWYEIPSYDEVRDAFSTVGRIKAEIEILDIEIDEIEREVKRGSRKSDDIDAAKEASKPKRLELARKKADLRVAEYNLDFLNYRRDVFKSVNFSSR